MIETLKLSSIRIDGGTQLRAETNEETVASYAADMLAGDVFPPIVVFQDKTDTWLSDGFHRYFAAPLAGKDEIAADVRQGTLRDAFLYAAEANRKHGLPLSNKDKRRIAELFLSDTEWTQWSDREIARRSGLSNRFISTMRQELSVNRSQIERKVERNGTIYLQNTANIGTSDTLPQGVRPSTLVATAVLIGRQLSEVEAAFEKGIALEDPWLIERAGDIQRAMRLSAAGFLSVGHFYSHRLRKHGYTLAQVFSDAREAYGMSPDHLSQLMLYAERHNWWDRESLPQDIIAAVCEVGVDHLWRNEQDEANVQTMNRSSSL